MFAGRAAASASRTWTTGVYFYPDINGYAYIKAQVQHPYGESDTDKVGPDASVTQSYTGYIGPFPAMN